VSDDELEVRQRLVAAAVELYMEDDRACTVQQAALRAGVEQAAAYRLFHGRTALLKYHYYLCTLRYQAMVAEIDGFEQFDLTEKFSNFTYVLFDLFAEEREFVEATFDELVFRSPSKTLFQRQLEEIFAGFLANGTTLPAAVTTAIPSLASPQYLKLVRHWLHDESAGAEETLALADKTIAFAAEALQSRLWSTGADLARYLLGTAVPGRGLEEWAERWRDLRR
jgi:hypothetical protein